MDWYGSNKDYPIFIKNSLEDKISDSEMQCAQGVVEQNEASFITSIDLKLSLYSNPIGTTASAVDDTVFFENSATQKPKPQNTQPQKRNRTRQLFNAHKPQEKKEVIHTDESFAYGLLNTLYSNKRLNIIKSERSVEFEMDVQDSEQVSRRFRLLRVVGRVDRLDAKEATITKVAHSDDVSTHTVSEFIYSLKTDSETQIPSYKAEVQLQLHSGGNIELDTELQVFVDECVPLLLANDVHQYPAVKHQRYSIVNLFIYKNVEYYIENTEWKFVETQTRSWNEDAIYKQSYSFSICNLSPAVSSCVPLIEAFTNVVTSAIRSYNYVENATWKWTTKDGKQVSQDIMTPLSRPKQSGTEWGSFGSENYWSSYFRSFIPTPRRIDQQFTLEEYRFGIWESENSFITLQSVSDAVLKLKVDTYSTATIEIVFQRKTKKLQLDLQSILSISLCKIKDDPKARCLAFDLTSAPLLFERASKQPRNNNRFNNNAVQSRFLENRDPWTPGPIGKSQVLIVFLQRDFPDELNEMLERVKEMKKHNLPIGKNKVINVKMEDSVASIYARWEKVRDSLSFEVRYMLLVLMSYGILHSCNFTQEFLDLLQDPEYDQDRLIRALLDMRVANKKIFNPAEELRELLQRQVKSLDKTTQEYCQKIRSVCITPTRLYFDEPRVQLSNRVTRQFDKYSDRFIRVSFTDEYFNSLAQTSKFDHLYKRISYFLERGVEVAGRTYHFLAYSSSQLRSHSAWFFASCKEISADEIRRWMGDFSDEKIVAKHASRMGQCFSSTFRTVELKRGEFEKIPDVTVKRIIPGKGTEQYIFSDGIGKISLPFALQIQKRWIDSNRRGRCTLMPELEEEEEEEDLSNMELKYSAYHFRFGGCKGVVSVDPTLKSKKMQVRESQYKFHSHHVHFEVIAPSKWQPCFLNRQVITILSGRDVPTEVFMDLQNQQLEQLDKVLHDRRMAKDMVKRFYKGDTSSILLDMIESGFPLSEPFIINSLRTLRSRAVLELKTKSRVSLDKGAALMGIMDEYKVLEYGEVFFQVTGPNEDAEPQVVTGYVLITKNPCFHPGDIRILKAVDNPKLRHLVNVLVFPQKGERPHPNEISGSDLDGDTYWICWEPSLFPPDRTNAPAMDFTPPRKPKPVENVTLEHIKHFFVDYIRNDRLGQIANAHLVQADKSDLSVWDDGCLELAALHSVAVDFVKTGIPASLPHYLFQSSYPDFMHKDHNKSIYTSNKTIGQLYRAIDKNFEVTAHKIRLEYPKTIDPDLIVKGYEKHLKIVKKYYSQYRTDVEILMNRYGIQSEMELVTGWMKELAKKAGKRRGDLEDDIVHEIESIRLQFRKNFLNYVMGNAEHIDIQKRTELASCWYMVPYSDTAPVPFLSFAWIVSDLLCDIKKKAQFKEVQ
jgi:RNA-dependent RNA polymerase